MPYENHDLKLNPPSNPKANKRYTAMTFSFFPQTSLKKMFVMCSPYFTSAYHIQIVKTSAQQKVHREREFFQSVTQAVRRRSRCCKSRTFLAKRVLLLVLSPQEFISSIKSNSCYRVDGCTAFDSVSLKGLIIDQYSLRKVKRIPLVKMCITSKKDKTIPAKCSLPLI